VPSIHVDYKKSRIKQYHKEGQALRTETTINDTYDFAIGRALRNLPALREIGFAANRRLLHVESLHVLRAPVYPSTPARQLVATIGFTPRSPRLRSFGCGPRRVSAGGETCSLKNLTQPLILLGVKTPRRRWRPRYR
jgi:hypothetical protein